MRPEERIALIRQECGRRPVSERAFRPLGVPVQTFKKIF